MLELNRMGFLEACLKEESLNFVKHYDLSKLMVDGGDNFKKGRTLFKTMPLRSSTQDLLTSSKVVTRRDKLIDNNRRPKTEHYSTLLNHLIKRSITISNVGNLKMTLTKIRDLKETFGSNFYGVLIHKKKQEFINPLHPLTAMSLLSDADFNKEENVFTIELFHYEDRKRMDDIYSTKNFDPEIGERNINNLINCFANNAPSNFKIMGQNNTVNSNGQVTIDFKVQKNEEEEQGYELYMVAHQMLTEGVVMPYYGSSAIKMYSDRDSVGMNVSPMLSCNINQDLSFLSGLAFDSKYQQQTGETITQMWYSICCGSKSNRNLEGLRTLVHSNGSSPHISSIISDGSLGYADMCNDKAITIFETAGFINKPGQEEAPVEAPVEAEEEPEEMYTSYTITYKGRLPMTKGKTIKLLSSNFDITQSTAPHRPRRHHLNLHLLHHLLNYLHSNYQSQCF